MDDFRRFLGLVLSDERHRSFYQKHPLNRFWSQDNLPSMQSAIDQAVTADELIHAADRTYMFAVNEHSESNRRACDWLVEMLSNSYGFHLAAESQDLTESQLTLESNSCTIEGRRVSPDFLRCYYYVKRIQQLFALDERSLPRVVEIGAGMGHLARLMLLVYDVRQYVIVDLPQTLAFSFAFLTTEFPDLRVLLYSPEADPGEVESAQLVFVPAEYAADFQLTDFDLAINTASLGEMNSRTIRHYMGLIQDEWTVRRLYFVNRFLNTIHVPDNLWRCAENECMAHFDRFWDFRAWELEPMFTRSPYVDTQIARYVEVAAVRLSPDDQPVAIDLHDVRGAIEDQDWYRLSERRSEMTLLSSASLHDFAMSGTLFMLWNGLRLTDFADPWWLETMLRYLRYLRPDREFPFEEEFLYAALLKELLGTSSDVDRLEIDFLSRGGIQTWSVAEGPVLVNSSPEVNVVWFRGNFFLLDTQQGDVRLERLSSRRLSLLPSSRTWRAESAG